MDFSLVECNPLVRVKDFENLPRTIRAAEGLRAGESASRCSSDQRTDYTARYTEGYTLRGDGDGGDQPIMFTHVDRLGEVVGLLFRPCLSAAFRSLASIHRTCRPR